ncbi:tetratricopeptide repeat protein [Streptomyces sp. NPDC089799]|uniref:tetratricopeptide repeat protein n=1 Tax=Streptomyces sp. NPDC089799 TaxID=3155066 RepID=UPI0034180969
MRDVHRSEAERLLARAVDEEVRRSGTGAAAVDGAVLLARGREALDALAASAAEEYGAYVRALDGAAAGEESLGEAFRRGNTATALLVTAVGALAAFGADMALGVDSGTALGAGAVVGAAGAVTAVLKVTATHLPAAHRRAGALGQPGGPEQLRLQWLSALEVRGIRPFLEQQRKVAVAARVPRRAPGTGPQLRGADRSAEARRRRVLEQSFGQLPEPAGDFEGRRAEVARIGQWVQAARASTETRPVVVVLHGEPGVGRTTLALRVAHRLRDQYRGACVVDLRGGSAPQGGNSPSPGGESALPGGEAPLPTREALLHLLNRLGAPREQLLFRERASTEQQVRKLGELYHQHVQGLPVAVVLDDAVDAEQVRLLVPERSDSLVLVTAREPLALPADTPAWVHHLEVAPLAGEEAVRLLLAGAGGQAESGSMESAPVESAGLAREAGGLPLALRVLGPLVPRLGAGPLAEAVRAAALPDVPRGAGVAGGADGARGAVGVGGTGGPAARALRVAGRELPEGAARLLVRLPLAGRASLGAAAAAALLDVPEEEALATLEELWRAGLVDRVRGNRFRMHDVVRAYAAARQRETPGREVLAAAHERLIRNYAQLADSVIRLVDGRTSTRANQFGGHGFASVEAALGWLDEESSFITAALRHTEGVDQQAVLDLLGALCDHCLLRGDLYRLGEINELTQAVAGTADGPGSDRPGSDSPDSDSPDSVTSDGKSGVGGAGDSRAVLVRSVQWRTGIAARQLGELDRARTTLSSVVDQFREANQQAGAARALVSLGITLHHQGHLAEAAAKIREAVAMQEAPELTGDRAWALHALAAVERDLAHLPEALSLLEVSLALHRESESVHGEAWAHFQRGQVYLRTDAVEAAEEDFHRALDLYGRTRDARGEAWAMTQLGRSRLVGGDPSAAAGRLREAHVRHREAEDVRGEAWSLYYLGQALEELGERDRAVRELERARTMFSRMRDVYGLACARHHSGRVTRDQRAAQTGNLRNSGFARQLLVDARADFRRIGLAHGEAWTCLELAVVDAGNGRLAQALSLCEEALALFVSYGDLRGQDWARFLRCTVLPYAGGAGGTGDAEAAGAELEALAGAPHPARDARLEDCVEAYAAVLARGADPAEGWQAWRLQMVPNRHSREIMGVPVT